METISRILILGVDKPFEIKDSQTGEIIPGRKMFYASGHEHFKRCYRSRSVRSKNKLDTARIEKLWAICRIASFERN